MKVNVFNLKVNLELIENLSMWLFGICVVLFWAAVLLQDSGTIYNLQRLYSSFEFISLGEGGADFKSLWELYTKLVLGAGIFSLVTCISAMAMDWVLFLYIRIKYDI